MSFNEDIEALVAANASGTLACPTGCTRKPLGTVAQVINGFAFQSKHFGNNGSSGGIPLVRIRDVVGGRSETFYGGPVPDGYWVEDGDVLVGMDGDFNLARWSGGRALLNQRVCKIVCDERKIRKSYLEYVLPGYLKLINEYTSSVTVKHLSSRTLQQIPIPVPSTSVQDRLIAHIDKLFAEIEEGEGALANARVGLETYRRSLLKAAFSGDLTANWREKHPPKKTGDEYLKQILEDRKRTWTEDLLRFRRSYSEPVALDTEALQKLPDGWTWASLQQAAFISGGITVDQKRKPNDPVEVPYLRVANVQRGYIDLQKVKTIQIERAELDSLALRSGDILLNEGGDRDKVGRGWIWEGQLPVCVHQNHVFKARPSSTAICSPLVSLYLNEMGRRFFLDEGKQTTNLASISLSKVAKAPVPLPPPDEAAEILRAIANVSNSEVEQAKILQSSISASVALRQSILNAAFRGELAR